MPTSPLLESSATPTTHRATASTPQNPDARPSRRALFQSRHLDLGDHGGAPTLAHHVAREHRVEWSADGSGSVLVTTTVGEASRSVFGPGAMPLVFPEAPPAATGALGVFLLASADDASDPVQMIDAVAELLSEWTLPSLHQSALVLLLARMDGITETGEVVDPLGRPGVAYLAESRNDARFANVLVVSEHGDNILAVETIYRGGVDELDIAAPAVIRSIAWR